MISLLFQVTVEGQHPAGWQGVSSVLLGDVGVWPMHCLDMLAERTGICIALGAARDLADIGFLTKHTCTQEVHYIQGCVCVCVCPPFVPKNAVLPHFA